jgi:CheY-like chemotaxis protein
MDKSKVKILLVEDDVFMRRLYTDAFKHEGYTITTSENGQEGLLQVYKEPPTVALLDVMMPKMNGLELLEKIKSDPTTKQIPVVMLTNLAGQADAENSLKKGAVRYIVKSEYEPKQVTQIVKEILAH